MPKTIPSRPSQTTITATHPVIQQVNTSRLLGLPHELQLAIMYDFSDNHTLLKLRATCRLLNTIYTENKTRTDTAVRLRIVALFEDFYDFLVSLHLPPDAVKRAPPNGWPSINLRKCKALRKSSLANEILRHLPYLKSENGIRGCIDDQCPVVDYSLRLSRGDEAVEQRNFKRFWHEYKEDRHLIHIAQPAIPVVKLVLDTAKGRIYGKTFNRKPTDETLETYFTRRKQELIAGKEVVVGPKWYLKHDGPFDVQAIEAKGPPESFANFYDPACITWARYLYFKFGWPAEGWRKEECLATIEQLFHQRYA